MTTGRINQLSLPFDFKHKHKGSSLAVARRVKSIKSQTTLTLFQVSPRGTSPRLADDSGEQARESAVRGAGAPSTFEES
jgi:hypothetical protein